ncbi:Heterogeneous nuclear ribonucleoprotein A1 [Lasiodiplodia hormozganensis]|uniref:Heterogeneous nuclear ribonucleoprotein A1 n=1 Tax=Lasiodiplodia hormozganensis TaxID=869390 RepID=A0AA39YNK6_9PEZI|nr:Heterogeneous nuclear ribonucleoprotein A1 [Lasiodiplodia hormozganensis]
MRIEKPVVNDWLLPYAQTADVIEPFATALFASHLCIYTLLTNSLAMYLLRRAALRAASSSSASIAITARPRTFTSLTSASAFRPQQQQWLAMSQRRFNSEDASSVRPSQENTTDETVTSEQATAVDAETSAEGAQTETAAFGSAPQPERQVNRRPYTQVDENQKTLYVGNLFYQTTEDHLRQEFSRFGNIVKTMIVRDPAGLSRGFGYVEFDSTDSATDALVQMNQRVLDGRRLTVQHHKRRGPEDRQRKRADLGPNPPSKTLFIGNMSFEMSDRDLNDLFRDIRNVLDVRVAIDRRTGQPRGFAHADFLDETSATKAMEVLKHKEIYGRRLRIDYSRSTPSQ